jgi:hypothetical protein
MCEKALNEFMDGKRKAWLLPWHLMAKTVTGWAYRMG